MAKQSKQPDSPSPFQGQLLLADPALRGDMFHRSVIFLGEHGASGAYGLILNQPTGNTVGELLTGDEFAPLRRIGVYTGGPVAQHQLTFAAFWWSAKKGFCSALRISAEEACAHTKSRGRIVRAFAGYSGWSPGQLENEMNQKSWMQIAPKSDLLGRTHDASLWSGLLRELSPYHRILAEIPNNPILN